MDVDENISRARKRKSSSRRSSILKKRPPSLTDNTDTYDREITMKSTGRRVSFSSTLQVKEFPKDSPRPWMKDPDVPHGGADIDEQSIQSVEQHSAVVELSGMKSLLTGQINHSLQAGELIPGTHCTDEAVSFQDPESRKYMLDVTSGRGQSRSYISEKTSNNWEDTTTKLFSSDTLELTSVLGGILSGTEQNYIDHDRTRVFDETSMEMEFTRCQYTSFHVSNDADNTQSGSQALSGVLMDSSNKRLNTAGPDDEEPLLVGSTSRSLGFDTPDKIDGKQFLRSLLMCDDASSAKQNLNLNNKQFRQESDENCAGILLEDGKNVGRSNAASGSSKQASAHYTKKIVDDSVLFDGDEADMSLTCVLTANSDIPSTGTQTNSSHPRRAVCTDHPPDQTVLLKDSDANMSFTCVLPAVGVSSQPSGTDQSMEKVPFNAANKENIPNRTLFLEGGEADMNLTSVVPTKVQLLQGGSIDQNTDKAKSKMVNDETVFPEDDEAHMSFTCIVPPDPVCRLAGGDPTVDTQKSTITAGEHAANKTRIMEAEEADMSFTTVVSGNILQSQRDGVNQSDRLFPTSEMHENFPNKTLLLKGDEGDMSFTSVVPSSVLSGGYQSVKKPELLADAAENIVDKTVIMKADEGNMSFTSVLPSGVLTLPRAAEEEADNVQTMSDSGQHIKGNNTQEEEYPEIDKPITSVDDNKSEHVAVRSVNLDVSTVTSTADSNSCQPTNRTIIFNETCNMEYTEVQPALLSCMLNRGNINEHAPNSARTELTQTFNKTIVFDKTLSEMDLTGTQPSGASITSKELLAPRSNRLSILKAKYTGRSSLYDRKSLNQTLSDPEQDRNVSEMPRSEPSMSGSVMGQLLSASSLSASGPVTSEPSPLTSMGVQLVSGCHPPTSATSQSTSVPQPVLSATSQSEFVSHPLLSSSSQSTLISQVATSGISQSALLSQSVTLSGSQSATRSQPGFLPRSVPSSAVKPQSCSMLLGGIQHSITSSEEPNKQPDCAKNITKDPVNSPLQSASGSTTSSSSSVIKTTASSGEQKEEELPEHENDSSAVVRDYSMDCSVAPHSHSENLSRMELTSHHNQSLLTWHSTNIDPSVVKERTLSLESVSSTEDFLEKLETLSAVCMPDMSLAMDDTTQETNKTSESPGNNSSNYGDHQPTETNHTDTDDLATTQTSRQSQSTLADCTYSKSLCLFGDWSQSLANSDNSIVPSFKNSSQLGLDRSEAVSCLQDKTEKILAPECDVETVDDYLSMFGITIPQKRCYRSSIVPVEVTQPQTLSEHLELCLIKSELEVKKSGCQQLSSLIEKYKQLTSETEKEIEKDLPEMVKKASANFTDYFDKTQQLSTPCLKTVKYFMKERKLHELRQMHAVLKNEKTLLDNAKQQLIDKQKEIKEAIGRMRKRITESEEVKRARQQLKQAETVLQEKQEKLAEKEKELQSLKENQRLKEELISQHETLRETVKTVQQVKERTVRMLKCVSYRLEHVSDDHVVLSFLDGCLKLDMKFGETLSKTDSQKCPVRHIKDFNIHCSVKDEQFKSKYQNEIYTSKLTKLGLCLVMGSLRQDGRQETCTDTCQLKKLLLELSVVAVEVEHWMKFLRFVAVKHNVSYDESSVTIQFYNGSIEVGFEVRFDLDVTNFMTSSPRVTVRRLLGQLQSEDVLTHLSQIKPGPDFIKTAVNIMYSKVLQIDTDLY